MLIIPLSGDHFPSAERLLTLELAQVLQAPEVNVQSVRTSVQGLLSSALYRERASEIKEDIAAMPSPLDVARVLEACWQTWSDRA
jgi:UDP:flavonoid glycosyltransferase YjiC (YdhE family)